MNSMLSYHKKKQAVREFNRNAYPPSVVNNKLEALKVLANSILLEVVSLEQNKEVAARNDIDLTEEVQRFESDLIRCALVRTGGRQRQAAKLLNVKPTTLHEKMKRYGILQTDINKEAFSSEEIDGVSPEEKSDLNALK